jgi:hypothetical protein
MNSNHIRREFQAVVLSHFFCAIVFIRSKYSQVPGVLKSLILQPFLCKYAKAI